MSGDQGSFPSRGQKRFFVLRFNLSSQIFWRRDGFKQHRARLVLGWPKVRPFFLIMKSNFGAWSDNIAGLLSYLKCLKGGLVLGVDLLYIWGDIVTEFCYLAVYFTYQIHPNPVSMVGGHHRLPSGRPGFVSPSMTQTNFFLVWQLCYCHLVLYWICFFTFQILVWKN